MSANEVWYYALDDGRAVGPMARRQLHRLWRDREVLDHTLVWDNDTFDWRPLRKTVIAALGGGEHEYRPPPTPTPTPAAQATSEAPHQPRPAKALTPVQQEKAARRAALQQSRAARSGKRSPPASSHARPSFPGTSAHRQAEVAVASTADPAATNRAGWAGRRWAARLFDLCVSALIALLVILQLARAVDPEAADQLLHWLGQPLLLLPAAMLAWIPFEALALSLFATTPGKLLWGIRVSSDDGQRLGLYSALQRSVGVVLRGLLLGIPPLTLLSQGWAAISYINGGSTSWDRAAGAELQFAPISGNRILIGLVASFGAAILCLDGSGWQLLRVLDQYLGQLL